MEAILLRFPHLGYQIFEQLDNPFLTICREVSGSWQSFIDNDKLPWIRMIIQHIKPLTSPWKKFFKKSNVKSLVEMATSVTQHFKELEMDVYFLENQLTNTVPLHFAAMSDNAETIERLIQIGAKLNEIDSVQCTPLHYAATNGHLTAYQLIMENNPTKNPECGNMTPFHMAAKHDHLSICELIIDNVEDKNPKNVNGETPLHYAAKHTFDGLEICQLIIDKVIDKNPRNESGRTPLHHAVTYSNPEVVQWIFNNIEDKNPPDNFGTTPLHIAADPGIEDIFTFIFDNIESKNPRDNGGFTPLHHAAKNGYVSICQLIIENVVDKNPSSDSVLSYWDAISFNYPTSGVISGLTPLHLAAYNGHYETCKLFLEKIEEKCPWDVYVGSPLDMAAKKGHLKICELIQSYL